MRYWIDRLVRSHKTKTTALLTSLILSQLCLSCAKEDKSTHYLKMVGSCNQQTAIKIFDETGGTDPYGKPVSTIDNKHFKAYVNTISNHIFTKIDKMVQCRGTASENPQVELVFVYRPAISRGIAPYNDSPTKFWDNRYLDSPWVKLAFDKSSQHNVRGVFVWNERQFLLDQAFIKTRHVSDTKPLQPIDLETFQQWALEYTGTKLTQGSKIANQLQFPVDILWLFKYVHSTSLSDSASDVPMTSLRSIIDGEKLGYTDMTKVILDRFFSESKTDIRYDNILDTQAVFNIDKYRIYPFTDEMLFKTYKSLP